jgi:hypothetical protein
MGIIENEEATLNAAETFRDLVTARIPDATEEEADFILWEHTAFPMADRETIVSQINTYAESSN